MTATDPIASLRVSQMIAAKHARRMAGIDDMGEGPTLDELQEEADTQQDEHEHALREEGKIR